MFPILDSRGNVIGFGGRVIGEGEPKYLNSPETPLFEKGRELYGLYQARRAIRDANQVLVVEGYMDVVALAQHGVENAVATLGTATTPMHVSKLLKMADNVVFCFDGDKAGRKAAWRALETSLPVLADGKVVSFLFLPQEDDPDSFVRREGRAVFQAALSAAKPLSQFLFAELAARVDMSNEEGRARFLSEAKPLLAQIEAPALATLLRRRLAELARLAPEEVDALVPPKAAVPVRRMTPTRTVRRSVAPEARLISWIFMRPEQAMMVPVDVLDRNGAEAATLREVIAFFSGVPPPQVGQAIAYFQDTDHWPLVQQCLSEPLLIQADSPDLDVAAEVAGLVQNLRTEALVRRHSELMRLLEQGTASAAQRDEYRAIESTLSLAKSGNPPAEERSEI
jgi:DNA primase